MAWSAAYVTATFELYSVGTIVDPTATPPELTVIPTAFSDGVTPAGSEVDFKLHVWNPATLLFDPKPPRVPDGDETQMDTLLALAPGAWTTADIARALKVLMRKLIVRPD
jgi:hypothetical protein